MFSQPGKIYRSTGFLILALILGCNNTDHSNKEVNGEKDSNATPVSINQLYDTINSGDRDTTVLLKTGEAFIKGHIIANKSLPKYTIFARKGQTVTAILKPLKKGGNVRINQVQQPGGAFDGPFGDSLSYTFKNNGNIRFIIGENLMAGDPYTGYFILHIILK
ncbi:MAG: hypothetical protein ABI760_21065 [Ferruginibacter sp.]